VVTTGTADVDVGFSESDDADVVVVPLLDFEMLEPAVVGDAARSLATPLHDATVNAPIATTRAAGLRQVP
jgi:hypothetical protein